MNLVQKAKDGVSKVRTYWKTPMAGRHMTFREIAAYSGGGIGAYMIITLGTACLLATGNTLISSTLGVDATDMYIMYVIAVLANIPLTGIRGISLIIQEIRQVNTALISCLWRFRLQLFVF